LAAVTEAPVTKNDGRPAPVAEDSKITKLPSDRGAG
jgi:hypothetical protein